MICPSLGAVGERSRVVNTDNVHHEAQCVQSRTLMLILCIITFQVQFNVVELLILILCNMRFNVYNVGS